VQFANSRKSGKAIKILLLFSNLQVRLLFSLCLLVSILISTTNTAVFAKANFGSQPDLSEEAVGKKVFEVCRIQVKASPDKVWGILTDYRNSTNVFPTMKKCELLQDKGHVKVMRHVIHPAGYPGTFDYVVEVSGTPGKSLEWHRVSGAFKEVDTYWKLEPAEGGRYTNVTYSSYINAGFLFPSFLVRGQMKDDLPTVLTALKTSSEGTTQIAQGTTTQAAQAVNHPTTNARNTGHGIVMQPAYASPGE
jgi:ribosome-associated toxin RatA of RatAB toxin-antitoxin module